MPRSPTTKDGSPACSRSRSSPSSSARRRRRSRSARRWSGRMANGVPIAAAGEVGKGFIHERTSETLPCQATDKLFCWDWARDHIDRYGTPTVQHLELVLISVLLGFAIAFALSLLAHRHAWLRPPLLAGTGVLYTIPSIAFFF